MSEGLELFYIFALFVMSVFIGFELINKVPPTLHTPLMSGTNAISGITLLGELIVLSYSNDMRVNIVVAIALVFDTINVVGGFATTDRMLAMFKKK